MIISKSKKFIYIHIDKAGGTSIEECLTPFLKWDDIIFGGTTLGQYLEDAYVKYYGGRYWSFGIHKHSSAKQIKDYVGSFWDKCYKFATVRDPIDISISLYYYNKDKLFSYIEKTNSKTIANLLNNKDAIELIEKNEDIGLLTLANDILSNKDPDSFIINLIESQNTAIIPQIKKLDYDDSINIFDISNINNSWQTILKNININKNVFLPVYNKSSNPGTLILKEETVKIIKNNFKEDYEIIPQITGVNWK